MKPVHYLMIAAAAGGLFIAYRVSSGVQAAANAVNPVNNNNVINKGANALLGMDNHTSSIGTKIYDWFHPGYDNYDPNAKVKK